jgi:hypothetical protein
LFDTKHRCAWKPIRFIFCGDLRSEGAVQVQTETSTLGGVVGERSITALPLVTRNFTQIMILSSGVNASVVNAGALGRGFVSLYTNGQNDISNTYQLDG